MSARLTLSQEARTILGHSENIGTRSGARLHVDMGAASAYVALLRSPITRDRFSSAIDELEVAGMIKVVRGAAAAFDVTTPGEKEIRQIRERGI